MRSLHIRTGDAAAARVIDRWIDRFALHGRAVDDPYRACALLIRTPHAIPEFVFVGLDRLGDDELQIVSLTRETWPGAVIVTYGDPRALARPAGPERHCDTAAKLEQLLGVGPGDLVRAAAAGPRSEMERRSAPQPPGFAPLPIAAQSDLPPPRTALRSPDAGPAPASGLSAREIAALLGRGHG